MSENAVSSGLSIGVPRERQQQRLERILELAPKLTAARAEVARLEAELDALMGTPATLGTATLGTAATLPLLRFSTGEAQQEEPAPATRPNGVQAPKADRKELIAERAAKGTRGPAPDPMRAKVVALTKDGLLPNAIAEKLGVDRRMVANQVYRARKAGELPKAKASR